MHHSCEPLLSQKQKPRSCGSLHVTKHPRQKSWTTFMLIVMVTSLYYSFQLTRASMPYRYHRSIPTESLTIGDHAPEFTELREWERNLPQHNLDLPYPEGAEGRFVFFANSKAHPVGWNNKLNDMCVFTLSFPSYLTFCVYIHPRNSPLILVSSFWSRHLPFP